VRPPFHRLGQDLRYVDAGQRGQRAGAFRGGKGGWVRQCRQHVRQLGQAKVHAGGGSPAPPIAAEDALVWAGIQVHGTIMDLAQGAQVMVADAGVRRRGRITSAAQHMVDRVQEPQLYPLLRRVPPGPPRPPRWRAPAVPGRWLLVPDGLQSDRQGPRFRAARTVGSSSDGGTASANLVTDYRYDYLNRMESLRQYSGGTRTDRTRYTYDALDRTSREVEDHGDTDNERTTTFTYQALANRATEESSRPASTRRPSRSRTTVTGTASR
jgi:hypothetical protein